MAFFGGGASVDLASPSAIGSTTPNTGAFTTLSATPPANTTALTSSGYSLTGTNAQSLFDLSGTWNTSGTPTAFKLNVTDTASNASSVLMGMQIGGNNRFQFFKDGRLRFNVSGTGILGSGSTGIEFVGDDIGIRQNNSTGAYKIYFANSSGFRLGSQYAIGWSSGVYADNSYGTIDLTIFRDGADVFAQRRSTNAQTFRLYNTFTDASNYERGFFRWNANVLEIGAEAAGTGANRTVRISAYDAIDFRNTQYSYSMGSVSGGRWSFNAAAVISGVCGLESNYGFQAASTRTYGWVSSANTAVAPDTALYRNAAGVVEVNNGTAGTFRDLIVRNFRMSAPTGVPTANNSTGTEGSIRWDADYIYICTATNTWKRVAIATW